MTADLEPLIVPGADRAMRWQDYAILVLSPLAVWLFLDPAMVLQRGMVDCWFYTGMGTAWEKIIESYGWGYYYVRFPVGFLHRLFLQGSDPLVGYLLVRWLLVGLTGAAVYLAVLRIFGRLSAIVTYWFMLNVLLFMRIIVSDYPAYISIPMASAGIGLWLAAGDRRRWAWCFGAGACFGVSANCHIFSSTGFGLFAVGMIAAQVWHRRALGRVLVDAVAVALGFVAICALGLLVYMRQIFPGFSPKIAWNVTTNALVAGSNYATTHLQPFGTWGAQCVYIYIPFVLLAAAYALRDKAVSDYRRSAILLGSALLLAFYCVYRFGLEKFVFEEYSYFYHAFIPVIFLVAGVISAAERRVGRPRLLLGLFGLAIILGIAGAHLASRGIYLIWSHILNSFPAVGGIVIVACLCIAVLRAASARWVPMGVFLFFFAVQLLAMASGYWVYAAPSAEEQKNIYRAGVKYSRYWAKFVAPEHAPWIWFKSSAADVEVFSLSFIVQCNSINDKWQYGGMPQIGEFERVRLAFAEHSYLLILGKGHSDVEEGTQALLRAGYEVTIVEEAWMDALPFRALVRVVKVRDTKPPATP